MQRPINGRIQLPLASWRKTVGCSLEILMRRMRRGDSTGLSLMPMESWSLAGLRVRMESGITPMRYQTEILVCFIRVGIMNQWMESGITWMKRPELCLMAGFLCQESTTTSRKRLWFQSRPISREKMVIGIMTIIIEGLTARCIRTR